MFWCCCICFLRYLLQASCVCSWSGCLTAFVASTLPAEQGMSQYLYFCPLSSLLKAFVLVNTHPLCLCGRNHRRTCCSDKKEKSYPVAIVKVLKHYLAERLVVTVQEWCQGGCWRLGTTRIRICCDPENQRVGVTTQALAYLLCLGAVIWISELFHRNYYTVFCLPAVPGWCNLNFRTWFFCTQVCWEQLCLSLVLGSRAAPFPTSHRLPKSNISLPANGWCSSCGAFLHGWLLFYVNNWQHAPCLNPAGTCQVTFSLRFHILSELTECSVL